MEYRKTDLRLVLCLSGISLLHRQFLAYLLVRVLLHQAGEGANRLRRFGSPEAKDESGPRSPTLERRTSEKDVTKGKLWVPSPEIKTRSISSVMESQNSPIVTAVPISRSLSMPAPLQ
jgi:hypothetical protein